MAEVGDVVQDGRGKWVTVAPAYCPNLHRLDAGMVSVGHLACTTHRGGHTTWWCREQGCGATVYGPPLDPLCTVVNGPAQVRNSNRR